MNEIDKKTLQVKVLRSELRKGKIILVLEPDLLTNQEFAVNPFYNEGSENNKIQEIGIGVWIKEKNGKIKAKAEYNGTHYTTGHRQIHSLNSYYLDKKDCAMSELLKTEYKYIKDESRMNQILNTWENEPDFKHELEEIINNRKEEHKKTKLKEAISEYDEARKRLEKLLN